MFRDTKFRTGKAQEIGLFPLSVLVLPKESIPLRIFEPRYIELINHIERTGETFAIPYIHKSQITNIGSIVKLKKIRSRYSDGQMLITIEGVQFCEITAIHPVLSGKLYTGGTVLPFPADIYTANKTIIYYLELLAWTMDNSIMTDKTEANIFGIIQKLQLTQEVKFAILSQSDTRHLDLALLSCLKYYKMLYIQEKLLNKNFELN
jgi:Lon protease-like protein